MSKVLLTESLTALTYIFHIFFKLFNLVIMFFLYTILYIEIQ